MSHQAERDAPSSAFVWVAWALVGSTVLAAALSLAPGSGSKSRWLVIACGLAVCGPPLAMVIAGYVGPLKRRPNLYVLFPAASIGGQTMFLSFVAGAIASERFGSRAVAFNVNWAVLIGATVGAYVVLRLLVARLVGRWEPFPEMVCPLVAFWMGVNLFGLEMVSAYLKAASAGVGGLVGFLPNALPHLIMGSMGFWLFVLLSRRSPGDS